MSVVHRTSTFVAGADVVVRLPAALGVKPGETLEVRRNGRKIELSPPAEASAERELVASMLQKLRELGPVVGGSRDDGRIEFPDRPGLY